MVTVTQDLDTTQGTTGILTSVTAGNAMGGMTVNATFTSGPPETAIWMPTGFSAGGAFGTNWSVTVSGPSTDTTPWVLMNNTGRGITSLVFDGGPGKTIFDRTFGGQEGTPGTGLGVDFNPISGLQTADVILATYRAQVAVVPNPPVGDIFRFLEIDFQNSGGFGTGRTLTYLADTDTTTSVLFPLPAIPEPGSLLLFGTAALGLACYRRLRPRPAA
jgi:hypothetical protein